MRCIFFHGSYDVPLKGSDKEELWDSEEVYKFLICAVAPVHGDYEPGAPECGFLSSGVYGSEYERRWDCRVSGRSRAPAWRTGGENSWTLIRPERNARLVSGKGEIMTKQVSYLKRSGGLCGNQLKLCAIAAMAADHLAWTIWPEMDSSGMVASADPYFSGRLAAPVMWFMISEGYQYTRNFKKYLERLFVFAVISHFAYNFCFGISVIPFQDSVLNQTSVIWALFCAALALYVDDDEEAGVSVTELAEDCSDRAAVSSGVSV